MKKIIVQKALEEAEYYCDKHPDRKCYSELKTFSWYGSSYDMMGIEIHLCDECLIKVYDWLENNYKIQPKGLDLI